MAALKIVFQPCCPSPFAQLQLWISAEQLVRDIVKPAAVSSNAAWLSHEIVDKKDKSPFAARGRIGFAVKALIENFGAILGGVTIALLLMSVSHEYGYFLAVGQHFQTILTTSDYFGNAVLWLPVMLVSLYFALDWNVLLGNRAMKPFGLNWGSLGWFCLIVVWPIISLFLPFVGLAAWIWALALLWMMYGDRLLPFENATDDGLRLLRRALLVLPVVGASLLTHGYSHGREDLKTFDNPYDLELKSGGTIHRIAMRTFDKGILVRDAINNRIEFVRWDEISRLSRLNSVSTLPLACKWFGWYCPISTEP